jgi:hypothetical protein
MAVSDFIKAANKRYDKQTQVTEKNIEDAYVSHAKKLKCRAIKLIYLHQRGFPDRTTLCPQGRILFIEFKREGKKPTAIQLKVRELLQSFGFTYFICDKIGQAEKHLTEFLDQS